MIQFLPPLIMFAVTVGFVTLLFVPATAFKFKNELIHFYWAGIWVFLALIAAFSFSAETLFMLDFDSRTMSEAILTAMIVCFPLFVMFGWFRLSLLALSKGIKLKNLK